jgi:drug/metabolite transporter (DMT)-like permease
MGTADWITLLVLSLLWGGSFFFVEVAVDALPPLTLVTLRVGLAAVVLWAFILARGMPIPRDTRVWVAFLGMGLLNNVIPFTLIVWGQIEISSGLAAILNATTPLFTVIVASAFLSDEKATPIKLIGVVIGLFGVIVMIGPGVLQGLGIAVFAQLAILAAAISYAFAGVFGRRFKGMGVDPMITATGQVSASTLVLLPITMFVDKPQNLPMPGLEIWASVLGLAVFSTALAYILYFKLLSSAGATNLLLVTFLIPVSAIWLGITILGEELLLIHVLGMALIGLGLLAIDGRLIRGVVSR